MFEDHEINLKKLFIPFTSRKAVFYISIVGFLVYFNILFNGFVWDDITYFIFNPRFHTINLSYLFEHNAFNSAGQYRPLAALYFTILFTLFNDNQFGYHLLQLTIHMVNTSLVFIFFTRFFTKRLSFVLALLFLIHPMQVESVSYIAASDNPLYFLFGMMAILLSLKNKISWKRVGVISSLLLLSLLINETGSLFLAMIVTCSYLFTKKNLLKLSIGSLFSLLIYGFFRIVIGHIILTARTLVPIASASFATRLITIPAIVFYYLKTFFFPLHLAIDQQWVISSVTLKTFYLPLLIDLLFVIAIIFLSLHLYRNKKLFYAWVFFLCWFLVGLCMHLQLYPLDMTVADRWFYFPVIGLLGLIGISLQSVTSSLKYLKIVAYIVVTVAVISLAMLTIVRNSDWQNELRLYTHDIQFNETFDLTSNLGYDYDSLGDYNKALYYTQKSVNERPYEANLTNLGHIYEEKGNIQKATLYYDKALKAPDYHLVESHKHVITTYLDYASILFISGNTSKAVLVIHEGLIDYPDSSELWMLLAFTKYKQHDDSGAKAAIAKAYQLNSQYHRMLLYIQNRKSLSIILDGKSLTINP